MCLNLERGFKTGVFSLRFCVLLWPGKFAVIVRYSVSKRFCFVFDVWWLCSDRISREDYCFTIYLAVLKTRVRKILHIWWTGRGNIENERYIFRAYSSGVNCVDKSEPVSS